MSQENFIDVFPYLTLLGIYQHTNYKKRGLKVIIVVNTDHNSNFKQKY